MSDINQFDIAVIPIDTVVMLSFYVVTGLYVLFTAVFYYHWKTYNTDEKVTNLTYILYVITTLPMLIVMGTLLLILV